MAKSLRSPAYLLTLTEIVSPEVGAQLLPSGSMGEEASNGAP